MAEQSKLIKDWSKYKYTNLFDNDNTGKMLSNAVDTAVATLRPETYQNLQSLIAKFPNSSKDYLLAAANLGLNANSKGIERLAAVDGLAQLKQDLSNVDNLKSTANQNKNFAVALKDNLYSGLKGGIRTTFATLQAPWQYLTTIGRDLYAASKGEIGAGQLMKDLNPVTGLLGSTTNLGQIISGAAKGNLDTGEGFFVSPDSGAGKAQATAMQAYGRINGKSYTPGRALLSGLGADPNSTPYKVLSGIVDAVGAIATDPSVWVGPGSVTKIIKGGKDYRTLGTLVTGGLNKKITGLESATASAGKVMKRKELEEATLREQAVNELTKEENVLIRQRHGAEKSIKRKVNNTYLKAENSLKKTQQSTEAGKLKRAEKLLTYRMNSTQVGSATSELLTTKGNIAKFVSDILSSGSKEDVSNTIHKLSADFDNTGGVFTGLYLNEIPESGRLHLAAYGDDEYVATFAGKKKLNFVDIGKTYEKSSLTERSAELDNRIKFFGLLNKASDDLKLPEVTRNAINEFVGATPVGKNALKATTDELIFGKGSESIAQIIARAVASKNEHLIEIVTEAVENTWKADGYSNIRAIHNGTGGFVVTNSKIMAARQVGITDVLSGTLDSPRLKTEGIAKLINSIKESDQKVTEARTALEAAKASQAGIDQQLKEISILRDYAAQDPELVAQMMNDPEYIGIAKAMGLEMDIADTQYSKEFFRAEVGLIDGFGGSLSGDLKKGAQYVLGKRFAQVAEVVARETDFSRLHRLFGRKLDAEMTKELVDATTVDQVLSIFLKHLAAPETDPSIYRSLTLRGEAALNVQKPLFKTTAPVVQKALSIVERTEKNFGRYFSKSVILPLDDLDRLVNGLEDWMSSAKIPENIIKSTINRVAATTSVKERSGVVFQEIEKAQAAIAEQIAPGDGALADAMKEAFRATGRENAIVKQYIAERLPKDEVPFVAMANGEPFLFGKDQAIFEYQFLDDVIKLPDTKDIKMLVTKYTKTKAQYGAVKALDVFQTELGDRWRTAQLAFRLAYIMRNIGEMQFRQYFSGHDSLLNHPLGYIALIAGDPNGPTWKKALSYIQKYGNDVLGNSLITKDVKANAALSVGVEKALNFIDRKHSAGDPRFAFVGKIYEAIGTDSPAYHLGLSNTIMRAHSDALIPIVAAVRDVASQDAVVSALIRGEGKYAYILQTLIKGGRNGIDSADFAKLFLIDSKKVKDGYNLSADNIISENVKNYLFDINSTGSVQRFINNIAGTGENSQYIKDLIASGEVNINGKLIRVPGYSKIGNIADMADEDKSFKIILSKAFPKDKMPNSTVIHARDKRFGPQETKYLDKAVNWFFDGSTKLETTWNFSPEYRMSYWDHVGRYANMLNDNDLKELIPLAERALKPLTVNGKSLSLRRHPSLRALNAEMRKRNKGKSVTDGIDRTTLDSMAARNAEKYTKNLFYDAARQRQYANAMRIIFPFVQAQMNTIQKWGKLLKDNPVQFEKIGRAYNALTQPGTSAIYDLTGVKHDENQGFFFKDEFGETRFRYPFAGSVIGAMVGKNLDVSQALQLTAPVQSLNLAMGAVNPMIPGIGPGGQILYAASGKSGAFGPEWNFLRQIIFPFGDPKGIEDLVLPSWMKKTFLGAINNNATVERGVKDWASYLASTGTYGDNPLADDAARTQMFNDARGLSRWAGIMGALFQSIAPATPSQEVFAKDKNGMFRTQTMMYNAWDQIAQKHPGDYFKAVAEFSDTFCIKNLLVIIGGSTRNVRGTKDAWAFLNNHPDAADKYATAAADIVPYFFPGGEAATAYYNWQKQTGRRRQLSREELAAASENIVYQMAKSQISEDQATNGYSDVWYTERLIELNSRFDSPPTVDTRIGTVDAKIAQVGKALKDPAFKDSSIYEETKAFYDAYEHAIQYLQEVHTTAQPKLSSSSWYTKEMSKNLQSLAMQLMVQNPAFSRMYYGVFAGAIEAKG